MTAWKWLVAGIVLSSPAHAQFGGAGVAPGPAAEPRPAAVVEDVPAPRAAANKIVAVTLYQGNALVTREVVVPEGKGLIEVVVTPLPPRTIDGSLYAEGSGGLHVLSTRYRGRAVKDDVHKEVRDRQEQIRALEAEAAAIHGDLVVAEHNLGFLQKLEGFTGVTLRVATEKGGFDSSKIIELSNYVMNAREETITRKVGLVQKTQANAEATEFARKRLAEVSSGSGRVEVDAVISIDKADAPAGTIRLNYLVADATWTPRYRIRAGGPKDPVRVGVLAAIDQRSGEDWADAELTLSTARPSFNATVPDLLPLDVSVSPRDGSEPPKSGGFQSMALAQGGMGQSMGTQSMGQSPARAVRERAGQELIVNHAKAGGDLLNQAAALDQANELLKDDADVAPESSEGPSVTYRLKGRRSIPSRNEVQVVEVSRSELAPEYFAKAVPVLSPRVYRLAKLVNTGDSVILPGEATMFVGDDFVGKMTLPLVSQGEPFTVGFGVDPTLQIGRRLMKKSRTIQGGNQVLTYEFRLVARNFGSSPSRLQVWDRLPKAQAESVAVNLSSSTPEPSADPLYLRIGKPDGLLRWDLDVPANTTGEKGLTIVYSFKIEFARESEIDTVASGLKEAPIGGMGGGMGGMGGGMRSVDRP